MKRYLDMMNQWFILKQEGKSIDRYLKKKGYCKVAIYGMAIYGRHVVRELRNKDIVIAYGIDRKKMEPYYGIEVVNPTGRLPDADVIINTVLHDQNSVIAALKQITDIPVVSLEDVVFESYD